MWRVWLSGKATLCEIQTQWNMEDLWTANRMLDLEADAQTEASLQARSSR